MRRSRCIIRIPAKPRATIKNNLVVAVGPDGAVVGAVAGRVEDIDVEVGGVEGVFALAAPGGEREEIGGPLIFLWIVNEDAAGVLVFVAATVAEEEELVVVGVVFHDGNVGVVGIGAGDVFGFGIAPTVGVEVEDPQRILIGGGERGGGGPG